MTAAPTASQILRSLDRHRAQAQFASLADLDAAHSDAVRRALSAVRPTSRIDVPKLLDSVRRDLAERAERKAQSEPDVLGILKYRLMLMTQGELERLRDDLRTRVAAGAGDEPFAPGSAGALIMDRLDAISARLRARGDAEPDPDLDDDDEPDAPPARRSIPRVRLGEAAQAASATEAPTTARARPTRATGRPERPVFGSRLFGPGDPARPFGCPVDVSDYEGWRRPPMHFCSGVDTRRSPAAARSNDPQPRRAANE